MNSEAKKIWVAALRSGEYTQGRDHMKQSDCKGNTSHCCLGVLVAVYEKETKAISRFHTSGTLPHAVQEWAGLPYQRGDNVSIDGEAAGLIGHNDGGWETAPKTFLQIADAIEAQL